MWQSKGVLIRLRVKGSISLPSDEAQDEAFTLMPSLLQGHTSIDPVSAVLLLA